MNNITVQIIQKRIYIVYKHEKGRTAISFPKLTITQIIQKASSLANSMKIPLNLPQELDMG
jgi:hypothetical protein